MNFCVNCCYLGQSIYRTSHECVNPNFLPELDRVTGMKIRAAICGIIRDSQPDENCPHYEEKL